MRIAMIACPAWANWAPNPALLLLAAQLRQAGHEVQLYDMNVDLWRAVEGDHREWWLDENSVRWERDDDVAELWRAYEGFFAEYASGIAAFSPQLVGFSVNSGARCTTPRFAKLLKQRLPDTPFVVGGADCFRSYHFTAHLVRGVMDALCPGEADTALVALAEVLTRTGAIPVDMPGFVTWENGEPRDNGDPERPRELDALAHISLQGVDLDRYALNNRVTMSLSRGCVRRCAFCSEGPNFWKFRSHSATYMVEQLEGLLPEIAAYGGVPHINFNDSLINGNMQMLEEMCDLILARGLRFTWGGMAIIRPEMTFEFMAKMRRAGCVELCWGIESGSAKVLSDMRKGITPSLMDQVIREAHAAGLEQYGNIMVGFPGEGPFEFAESMLFAVKNTRYFNCLGLPIFSPQKNSTVYKLPERFDMASLDGQLWATQDDTNTPEIRVLRRAILADILAEKKFDQGRYDKLEGAYGVDLSTPKLQAELQAILRAYVEVTQAYLAQAPDELPLLQDRHAAEDKKGQGLARGKLRLQLADETPAMGGAQAAAAAGNGQWMTVGGGRSKSGKQATLSANDQTRVPASIGVPQLPGFVEAQRELEDGRRRLARWSEASDDGARNAARTELAQTLARLATLLERHAGASQRLSGVLPPTRALAEAAGALSAPPTDAFQALERDVHKAYELFAVEALVAQVTQAERRALLAIKQQLEGLTGKGLSQSRRLSIQQATAGLRASFAQLSAANAEGGRRGAVFQALTGAFLDLTRLSAACQIGKPDAREQAIATGAETMRALLQKLVLAAGSYVATRKAARLSALVAQVQQSVLPAWNKLDAQLPAAPQPQPQPESESPKQDGDKGAERAADPGAAALRIDNGTDSDVAEELEAVLDDIWDGLDPQAHAVLAGGDRAAAPGPASELAGKPGAHLLDPHMLTTVALDALHGAAILPALSARLGDQGGLLFRSEALVAPCTPMAPPAGERMITVLVAAGAPEPLSVHLIRGGERSTETLSPNDVLLVQDGTRIERIEGSGHCLVGHFCMTEQEVVAVYGSEPDALHDGPAEGFRFCSEHYDRGLDGRARMRGQAA